MKALTMLFCFIVVFVITAEAQTEITVTRDSVTVPKIKKILVLSMNNIYENRITVENEITWWLNDRGYWAYPANKLSDSKEFPSKVLIHKMVEDNDLDGVLISDIIDVQMKEHYENTQERYNYNPTAPSYNNFLDSYRNELKQGYNYNTRLFVFKTRIFDVKTQNMIFEANSSTQQTEDLDKAIENYSKSLTRVIIRRKVLEKREN